jgi:sugar diacid utilization regulator
VPQIHREVARDQLSSFHALLVLSMVMTRSADEDEILQLMTTAVPSLAPAKALALWLDGEWRAVGNMGRPHRPAQLRQALRSLPQSGGPIGALDEWAWGYPITTLGGVLGFLVATASAAPGSHEQFLLGALGQHSGVALANARSHAREKAAAEQLRLANQALERNADIHERLTAATAAGQGQPGIARAVHELTGRPVAVEDRHGNLVTWAGPGPPDPYPKAPPRQREDLLRRLLEAGRPVALNGRVVAVAAPGAEVMGLIALVDPTGQTTESDLVALEHGATLLAMELAHLSGRAETALRLRRDLVEELLAGIEPEQVLTRARILDYDLARPHRVVAVECRSSAADPPGERDDRFHLNVVRRAALELGAGSLFVSRGTAVIILADRECDWEAMRQKVLAELGRRATCAIGVGGICCGPQDFPRSLHQAKAALRLQRVAHGQGQTTVFDTLGVYRMFAEVPDDTGVEDFIREWLGTLIDYDERKGSQLVETLSCYLECGGNYDATAKTLSLHRSSLRYRLQRLREVSGHDFADPDVRFNLHLATRAWGTLRALRDP